MMNHRPSFDETINEFDPHTATVGLEKIKSIVSEAKKVGITHRIVTTFLLPTPLILSLSIRAILRSHPKLNVFASSILQKNLPIAIATVFYFVMWLYLLPIILAFWRLFHQIYSLEEFFINLFRWDTFQSLILILIHSFFARIAMNGFRLTKTFYDRYDLLRKLEKERGSRELTMIKASNKTIADAPQLINSLIHQTINALVASGKFSPENVKAVTETMKGISHQFLNGATHIDYQPSLDFEEKLLEPNTPMPSLEEQYGEYEEFNFSKDKRFK
ncbi:MAG: hypothetical protein AAFR77_13205 [Cyanobacteria bacterium J06631_2]